MNQGRIDDQPEETTDDITARRIPYIPRRPDAFSPEVTVRKTIAPITLVTRNKCPLCSKARRLIAHAARRYRVAVEEVNVEVEHPDVFEKWKYDVPVVLIDGKRRFSGHISPTLLEKALQTRPR